MRAALYSRVSSDPKGLGRSVSEQEAECQAVAERENWQVVRVFRDNDKSAYRGRTRPAYQQLVQFVSEGGCDVLITWEASRFQRDLEDYVKLRELCRNKGVLWSYNGRIFDLSRTDDRLMTGLDALLAERESDMTRDRILRSVRSNAAKGRPHGKRLYGYAREYDPDTGALVRQVVREDQASVIKESARRFLAGETTYAIAEDLNARRIPAPMGGKWVLSQIRRMLINPAYISKRVHLGKIVGDAQWPPILDEATFYQCQARFADPRRKTVRDTSIKYLLSGLMTCGVCGGRIRVQKNRTHKAYLCHEHFCVSREYKRVDNLITQLVIARLSQPDILSLLADDSDPGVQEVLDEVAKKRARLETFYDSAAGGEISSSALGRIETRLLSEIEALERQARRINVPTVVYDLVKKPRKVWDGLSLTQKREVIALLMNIRLVKTQQGARSLDPQSVIVDWRIGNHHSDDGPKAS